MPWSGGKNALSSVGGLLTSHQRSSYARGYARNFGMFRSIQ